MYFLMVSSHLFAVSPNLIIYEVYGGGGNASAPYQNDYIVLYNTASTSVNTSGWSVQYAAATGTSWTVLALNGIIPAGSSYLIKLSSGGAVGTVLPTPNQTFVLNINAQDGKIAIRSSTVALSGANPVDTDIVDKLGYGGSATGFETAYATGPSDNTKSVKRINFTDTDHNFNDFSRVSPSPITNTPLPVAYSYFRGILDENQRVILTWATALESNNQYFEIEKSTDAANYVSLGKLVAHNKISSYTFKDEIPITKATYFRIKQIDFDDAFSYSRPIALLPQTQNDNFDIKLWPNPSTQTINIQLPENQNIINYSILKLSGSTVADYQVFKQNIDIQSLQKGIYILVLKNQSGQTLSRKFVKE